MKILIVSPIFDGLSTLILGKDKPVGMPPVYKLQKELVSRGHTVVMIGPPSDASLYKDVGENKIIQKDGITYHLLRPAGSFLPIQNKGLILQKFSNLLDIIYYFSEIRKAVKKERPDVIYSAFQMGMIGNYFAKKYNIPSILRAYGTFLGSDVRPGNIYHWTYKLRNITAWLAFKSHYSFLIMTNDGTKGDVVARAFGVPSDKLKFWLNGVKKNPIQLSDDEKFKLRETLGFTTNHKIILTVSRLADWKRVDRVIKAAPEIYSQNKDVRFLIVGDGPERDNLQKLARNLSVEHIVKFTGFVPHETVEQYMQIGDIFVSAYDVSNLGNPILEAMINGKAIVSIDDGSLDGIIQHKTNGILLNQPKVEKELVENIIELLANDQLRSTIGKNAKAFADQHLETWDQRILREIELIESL